MGTQVVIVTSVTGTGSDLEKTDTDNTTGLVNRLDWVLDSEENMEIDGDQCSGATINSSRTNSFQSTDGV